MRGRALIPAILIMVLAAGCADNGADKPAAIGPSQDNGVATLPAEEILSKAVEAASAAKSVRVSGNVSTGEDNFRIDMRTDGTNARGTVKTDNGGIEILKTDGQVYLRADMAYWKEALPDRAADAYQGLTGKWVKAKTGMFDLFGDLSSVDKLVRPPAKTWQKGGVQENLEPYMLPVITLHSDTDYMLAVMVKGPPYPVQLVFPAASGGVDLTEWGKPVKVEPPAPGDIAELPAAA